MPRAIVTEARISDHVHRIGELYPPIDLAAIDYTVRDPAALRDRYGGVLEYLSRVELEVERNVLELLVLLPDAGPTDRTFYADVWYPQELHHGLALDRLQQDLGLPAAAPGLEVSASMRILGALAHLSPVQDIVRLLYYLTGASTERQAVLAYNTLNAGLLDMGERAIADTLITPVKRQEPGHFAFYRMSATHMIQHGVLRPWQLFLARVLRKRTFAPVGARTRVQWADYGGVVAALGMDAEEHAYAAEVGRVEAQLLWAHRRGMDVPPYVLDALRESTALYQARKRSSGMGAGSQ